MVNLLSKITPDDVRKYGLIIGLAIVAVFTVAAVLQNRKITEESAAKGYEFGKSMRAKYPWIKIVEPIVSIAIVAALIYWFFIAK